MPVFMTVVYKISRFSKRSVENMRFKGKGSYKYLLYLIYLVVKLRDNASLQLQQLLAITHKLKTTNQHLRLKLFLQMLCLWFRASLIYINNCPTKCNTKQSIYYSASSLYMFRVSTTPIIRSTQIYHNSLRYWSYFLCSYFTPTWPSLATLE